MAIKNAHVWVGQFKSAKVLDKYMDENFDEDDDKAPISKFAEDQKTAFYDSDLVFAQFTKKATPRSLVTGWEFAEKPTEAMVKAIEALNLSGLNVCIVADKGEFAKPKSAQGEGYEIWYVGLFKGCGK